MNTFKSFAAVATLCTAGIAMPAHAGIKWNGSMLQGISLNGISLQGISLNGVTLQGIKLQGTAVNGNDKAGQPVAVTLPDGTYLPVAR